MQLDEFWGSKNKVKFLYFGFEFGFEFVLGSPFLLGKMMVLFGLENWSENCVYPDMTGGRNSDCKGNLERHKTNQHKVQTFSSKKHFETDKIYVHDPMSWKSACPTEKLHCFSLKLSILFA